MCKFKPFNKHILVEKTAEQKSPDLSPVLIPEDAKLENKERYGLVRFVCAASDCEDFLQRLNPETPTWATHTGTMDDVFTTSAKDGEQPNLVVEQQMVEEVKIDNHLFHVIHQNYIVGIITE
tara:strand:- start:1064 stop:1429 length:366 start_codon:yes stop_codon:yes gene_type:complete